MMVKLRTGRTDIYAEPDRWNNEITFNRGDLVRLYGGGSNANRLGVFLNYDKEGQCVIRLEPGGNSAKRPPGFVQLVKKIDIPITGRMTRDIAERILGIADKKVGKKP